MKCDLKDKVILVTGSSRGLGKLLVKGLVASRANLIINYRSNEQAALELLEEISCYNSDCIAIQANVCEEGQVKKMYKEIMNHYGRLDVLINNAGICDDDYIQFMSYTQWDRVIKNNLYSSFLCCRHFSKALIKNGGGKIINIASLKGQVGSEGQCNYSASKAGMIGLTKALARELGPHNISVNAVCPGFAVTDLNRDNKNKVSFAFKMSTMSMEFASEDLVNFITFFCSDCIRGVSGRVFNLDSRIL